MTYYSSSAPPNVTSIKIHPKIYDVQDTIQPIEPEEIVVKVHPEGKFMDIDEQNKPLGVNNYLCHNFSYKKLVSSLLFI